MMTGVPSAVHALFAAQHGIASVEQLVGAGLSTRQIEHLRSAGQLVNAVRGAYATPSVPMTELSRCAAICLAHPDVVVAGPTAGRLWGFRHVAGDRRLHVIGPPASNPTVTERVIVYRTKAIHPEDVVERGDGIRVTSRARTAYDLTRILRPDIALSIIEQAMHDGMLSDAEMRAVAVDWMSKQRPWISMYLSLLDRRLSGSAAESGPEVRIGQALAAAGIRRLERQFAIDLPDYGSARFDLAVPSIKWAIEVDIFPTHQESAGRINDARRDAGAERLGWLVSRVDRSEYEHAFDETIRSLAAVYRARSATHKR
jgi:very-short-patch-repair endonuclease